MRLALDPYRRPRLLALVFGLLFACGGTASAVAASTPGDEPRPDTASARVSFIAGASVYVTAGRSEGIEDGDTLGVFRDGKRIGFLAVRFLSSHRASCEALGDGVQVRLDDEVRFLVRAAHSGDGGAAPDTGRTPSPVAGGITAAAGTTAAGPSTAIPAAPGPPPTPAPRRTRPVRGRIAARYLSVDPQDAVGFTQPGLDLRLDANRIAGSGVDFTADLRGRRTVVATDTSRTTEARLYRLALSVHDAADQARLTIGRQVSPSLAAISLFDGGLARLDRAAWGLGVFVGTEPDPADFAPSGSVLDAGLFYERRGRAGAATRWNATGGFVASYDQGNVNRHFFFLQASASRPRWSMHLVQEIDFNFGWKRDMGEEPVSPSNTFVTARFEAAKDLDVRAGYDGRRNVLLYADHETPEGEFDDRFRQGAWLGAGWRPVRTLRVGADARWNGGDEAGDYKTWSGDLEWRQPEWLQSSARLRGTRLTGSQSPGWLWVGGYSVRPARSLELGVEAGRRTVDDPLGGNAATAYEWISGRADVLVYRGLYLLLSIEQTDSPGTRAVQTWSSLSWNF